ncbi:MAG: arginase family protein [Clostridia bacterium]|nr:arginase family protein [Clostridia bacterium]
MGGGHLNLVFPQWQGSWPDDRTYPGALDIVDRYLGGVPHTIVPVCAQDAGCVENDIAGYRAILRQLRSARSVIDTAQPDTLFTIGGGCDADVLSIAYLDRLWSGDMALLWIDAHADLNIPVTSATKRFYGMPVRTLIGEGDAEIVRLLGNRLDPARIIQLAVRDVDPPEREYLATAGIRSLSVAEAEQDIDTVVRAVRDAGKSRLYIHIDLDALDPDKFPHVPLPVPEGLDPDTLIRLLRRLLSEFRIPGMGLFEYMPARTPSVPLLGEILPMGLSLGGS